MAVLAPNTLTALEPHFAVPLAGAVLVMLNTRLQAAELAWILNHCGAKALIADPQLLPIVQPVMDDLKQSDLRHRRLRSAARQGRHFPSATRPRLKKTGDLRSTTPAAPRAFPRA